MTRITPPRNGFSFLSGNAGFAIFAKMRSVPHTDRT